MDALCEGSRRVREETEGTLPRVIVLVQGGVVQFAKSSIPIDFDVADMDNLDGGEGDAAIKALADEFAKLPIQCY
jgi:hypothetical protein